MNEQDYDLQTLAIRGGTVRSQFGEHSEALFLTSSFVFENAAQAAARFKGEEPGNIYARFTNPTVSMFENRLALMEGAERCVAFGSGMAAILATVMGLLKAGEHIVASRTIFGSTVQLVQQHTVTLRDRNHPRLADRPGRMEVRGQAQHPTVLSRITVQSLD